MSEPRAQRTVAPTHSPSFEPAERGTAAPGSRRDDAFIVFAYAIARAARPRRCSPSGRRPKRTPTPDEIHQLRVAARRLRVALRLFGRMLPSRDAARFRADLRWFASSLGDARDLDVYAKSFKAYAQALPAEQRSELSGYELYLRRERAEARQRAAAVVRKPAHRGAVRRHRAIRRRGAERGRAAALGLVDGARRRAHTASGTAPAASAGSATDSTPRAADRASRAAHQSEALALRARVLRRQPIRALKLTGEECKTLQELLGAHQDVYTATARLRRYANAAEEAR